MSRNARRWICVLLSVLLLLPLEVMASAAGTEESQVQPRLSYTGYAAAGLSITTSGLAYCSTDVEGYDGITTKVHIKMTLQKYTVLWWSTVETWEATFNDVTGALVKTKQLTSGGTYRVKAVFTSYSGSDSEKITVYSQEDKITL